MGFGIRAGGEYIVLDSTQSSTLTETGQTTDYTLDSGVVISDHYINKNSKVSIEGTISSIKSVSSGGNKSPSEYLNLIRGIKKSATLCSVEFSSTGELLNNCLIESLDIRQDSKRGGSGGSVAYSVSITFSQVRFATAVDVTIDDVRVLEDVAEKDVSGNGTTDLSRRERFQRIADEARADIAELEK